MKRKTKRKIGKKCMLSFWGKHEILVRNISLSCDILRTGMLTLYFHIHTTSLTIYSKAKRRKPYPIYQNYGYMIL